MVKVWIMWLGCISTVVGVCVMWLGCISTVVGIEDLPRST
jgi:hypothetical protein